MLPLLILLNLAFGFFGCVGTLAHTYVSFQARRNGNQETPTDQVTGLPKTATPEPASSSEGAVVVKAHLSLLFASLGLASAAYFWVNSMNPKFAENVLTTLLVLALVSPPLGIILGRVSRRVRSGRVGLGVSLVTYLMVALQIVMFFVSFHF